MNFRESLNSLIRVDKPQSTTEVIFLIGSITLMCLWVYACVGKQSVIPHVTEIISFLVLIKGVKVASDFTKKPVGIAAGITAGVDSPIENKTDKAVTGG